VSFWISSDEQGRYESVAWDNPAPRGMNVSGILSYLHHLAVLAGGLEDGDVPRTMPRANKALPAAVGGRLPYSDRDRE
jgi:hypothetical protein